MAFNDVKYFYYHSQWLTCSSRLFRPSSRRTSSGLMNSTVRHYTLPAWWNYSLMAFNVDPDRFWLGPILTYFLNMLTMFKIYIQYFLDRQAKMVLYLFVLRASWFLDDSKTSTTTTGFGYKVVPRCVHYWRAHACNGKSLGKSYLRRC